jgi:hypothetical protein
MSTNIMWFADIGLTDLELVFSANSLPVSTWMWLGTSPGGKCLSCQ